MLTCIIIEDEPLATEVLVDYIKQVPVLRLRATFTDALGSLELLRTEKIDVIFLDIHLPGMKGLDFLKTLSQPPAIILTTAYHQYAVDGYSLNVVDYLLKPIEFNRFVEAVNKVQFRNPSAKRTISIHSEKKTIVIPTDDIIYIEAQKEYVKVVTAEGSFLTKYSLTRMDDELDPSHFIRVHRSFIVSIGKIKAFTAQDIELPGKSIPIGGNYRTAVAGRLAELFS